MNVPVDVNVTMSTKLITIIFPRLVVICFQELILLGFVSIFAVLEWLQPARHAKRAEGVAEPARAPTPPLTVALL